MTYPKGAVTFGPPAFRTIPEAQAWATAVHGWAVDLQNRFNALLSQTRISQAAAITSLSLAAITDPAAFAGITDPADTPLTADALRDDLVANTIPSIETNMATFRGDVIVSINDIEARLSSIQTAVNAALAALRTNNVVAT